MKNTITIQSPVIKKNKILYQYEITGSWAEAFKPDEAFFIEYSCDVSGVPEGVAAVPLIANLLPIAWIYDAEIIVPVCDEDFYDSIEEFKNGYRKMYPMMDFRGKLSAGKIQKNIPVLQEKRSAAFFSGGVDAFHTLVSHVEEFPTLFTLWGADVTFEDVSGWKRVETHLKETAEEFHTDFVTIQSCFRRFLDEGVLTQAVSKSGDGWWHGFQHGIGIISHAAPAMYALGKSAVYFASSFTEADRGKVTCASDPTIDNYVRFCGVQVIHDGYECTRQMKIHNITQYSKESGKKVPLRVCWESSGGSNCCNCEKCWRTILGIYAEGFEPKEFGFEYDNFSEVAKKIHKNAELLKHHRESRYAPMQHVLRQNYTENTVCKELKWFYQINIEKLGEISLWKKVIRKGKRILKKFL